MSFKTLFNPFTGKLQKAFNSLSLEEQVQVSENNIALNSFRIASIGDLTYFKMDDGIIDDYNDETGVDTGNCANQQYFSTEGLYRPVSSGIDSNVYLMLHLNGTDGQKSTTDSSDYEHTLSFGGNAELDTAVKKFGTSSLYCASDGDYIYSPASSDWNLGTGDFTIDFWINTTEATGGATIIGQAPSFSTTEWVININSGNNPGKIGFWARAYNPSVAMLTSTSSIADGSWHHVAVVRKSGRFDLYIDGTSEANYTGSVVIGSASWALYIGKQQGNPAVDCNGYFDEIRLTHDAKWDTNFTPPTEEYSRVALDMILQSVAFTADSAPSTATIILLEEDVDSIVLNTDLKAYASRDNGSTWTQLTFVDQGDVSSTQRLLRASGDISSQPSGTNMKYKYETFGVDLKIHATTLNWK